MLELEVVPERSVGTEQWEFELGMAFSQAVLILQQQYRTIRDIQVLYGDRDPLALDLIINLTQDGIRLVFDSLCQRLKLIEVIDMTLVKLKYCGIPFCSPEVPPTLEQIDHSFGATHPGVYDAGEQVFILNFRGLSFSFPVEPKHQPHFAHGLGSVQFPSTATSPVVSKMCIYTGNVLSETKAPALPITCYYNYCYSDKLDVLRSKNKTIGIRLSLSSEGICPNKVLELKRNTTTKELKFGDWAQDVASALGSPNKIFYKADDKMKIHSPNSHKLVKSRSSDYFMNYFTLGLDVLIDAQSHKAKKFILHTNYPGHYNFNTYQRCNFSIPIQVSRLGDPDSDEEETFFLTALSRWDQVKNHLEGVSQHPVILNRTSSTNTTNPFGSTFCYGYQDMIFEVMANNHIASVTLYHQQPCMDFQVQAHI